MYNLLFTAAADIVGKSLLSETLKTSFQQGLANVTATHAEALELVIPVSLGIVVASAAANFVLGKVKGVFGWAS